MKRLNFLTILITAAAAVFFAGCGVEEPLERVRPESKPYTKQLPAAFNDIQLNKSTSVQVLDTIKRYKQEQISESKSVIAGYGEKKGDYQFWMTLVAFDEDAFTATRKYFLAVNEKPWFIGAKGQKLRFDTDEILDEKTLTEAYTSENQKRIAILKKVLENTRDDISQIKQESKILDTGEMMINQTFERILYVLSQSPVLAAKLDQEGGLEFDHPTMGKGRVEMKLEDKIVKVRILIGRLWELKFGKQKDKPPT